MPDPINLTRRTFLLAPMAMALAACSKADAKTIEISGQTMGTTYNVVALKPAFAPTDSEVQTAIDGALAEVDRQMSNWRADSEISRFNAQRNNTAVSVSPELARVMQTAESVRLASQGSFDTTIGPLIELWGFGAAGTRAVPGNAEIEFARARSGQGEVLNIGPSSLQKQHADTQIYLAGIGKGYGADRIGEALQSFGIKDYMIEIGGDLYAAGQNPDGRPWQIGIETPDAHNRSVLEVVGVSDLGMASSGDYRNYFEQNGNRFSHLIDPTTGRPVTHNTASATVLADNAMLADAWSTAMLILGRERGLQIAEDNNLAVLFVERTAEASQLRFTTASSTRFNALTS